MNLSLTLSALSVHTGLDVPESRTKSLALQVCLYLTREEVEEACAEMFFLQALHSEFVVEFIGFVVIVISDFIMNVYMYASACSLIVISSWF